MLLRNRSLSSPSFLVVMLCILLIVFNKSVMKGDLTFGGAIAYDVFGYYLYLPATFIHGDPLITDPTWLNHLFETYEPSYTNYQVRPIGDGTRIIKYSMGMAILYLPWFLIGHGLASLFGFPTDGMSMPYLASLVVGSFIYLTIGFFLLRKILLKYFSEKVTSITILSLVLGTNLLQIASNGSFAPHPFLFTLYLLVTWQVIMWYDTGRQKHFFILIVAWGLAVLARPSAIVIFPVVFLWGCQTANDLKDRFRWWMTRWKGLLKGALILCLIMTPQLIYWYATSGRLIFYSYTNDGFDFLTPYFADVLLSYKKGWWIYTPLMVLSLLGLLTLYRYNRSIFLALSVFWIVNLYLVSSWNCWWYGGSYGHRAFVESYGLYAIGWASIVSLIDKSSILKYGISTILILGISLNLLQTWQINNGILSSEYMTKSYYWRVFGKVGDVSEHMMYRGLMRSPATKFNRDLPYRLVLDTTALNIEQEKTYRWRRSGFHWVIPYQTVSLEEHSWWHIRAYSTDSIKGSTWLKVSTKHDGTPYKHRNVEWQQDTAGNFFIDYEYLSPQLKAERDEVHLSIISEIDQSIKVDSLRLQVFEPTWY